jgi:hypothetical protein
MNEVLQLAARQSHALIKSSWSARRPRAPDFVDVAAVMCCCHPDISEHRSCTSKLAKEPCPFLLSADEHREEQELCRLFLMLCAIKCPALV